MHNTERHCLFYTSDDNDVILLLDGHPLDGQVFTIRPTPDEGFVHTLTRANCLVPTATRLTGPPLDAAKRAVARLPTHHYKKSDGFCQCPDCFAARTNYPQ